MGDKEDCRKLEKIILEQNKAYDRPLPARWPIVFKRIEIDDEDKKE